MARNLSAPFALRARRLAAFVLPALLVATVVGCGGHRRSSMRPVYLRPSTGCPTGNCGGTVVPSSPSSTVIAPGGTSIEPAVVEPGSAAGASVTNPAPITSSPADRSAGSASSLPDSPPPVTGPSVQGSMPDEPGLEPAGAEERKPSAAPAPKDPSAYRGAGSLLPGASLKSTNGRRTTSGRVRQASLSDTVAPFVTNPDDLFAPPKADRPWKYVVLHHSASSEGSYDSIDRQHRDRLGWQGCGYHFIIGNGTESPDGRIEVSRRWTDQKHGVHCRDGKNPDVNEYGIGICLVGDLEKSPPTEKQVEAAKALVAYLSSRYQIAPDHTETHAHLAASPTSCPGRMFPSQAILGSSALTVR